MSAPVDERLAERLRGVVDPELGVDVVTLGMLTAARVEGRTAHVELALTTVGCPLRSRLDRDVRTALAGLEGVDDVVVTMGVLDAAAKAVLMDVARRAAQERAPTTTIAGTVPVLAVGSGKGGVGKSSVTANLAVALAELGHCVGVLDADVGGFSLPRLLGMRGPLEARDGRLVPMAKRQGAGELRVVSMGFLADEDQALLWRGLILNKAVQQFIEDADWGGIDYLVVDLPPGTSDVPMGLARTLPQTGLLVVTTPPLAAQLVAARAGDLARRANLRVLGVIENMSSFVCEHGTSHALFGHGGGARLADQLGVELLASIPLDPALGAGGDEGAPVASGDHPAGAAFRALAHRVTSDLAPPPGVQGCTARLLDAMERAVPAPS
ncbi:MAG TPA: P-loop NTPase [Acidimicrobiales bacterium]|nr:P-loop NTPase [Acidimicrobiales bacterium]